MKTIYQVLNPEGQLLGTGLEPVGIARYVKDHILILDDHKQYSVATYGEGAIIGKASLLVQNAAEDFYQQVVAAL